MIFLQLTAAVGAIIMLGILVYLGIANHLANRDNEIGDDKGVPTNDEGSAKKR